MATYIERLATRRNALKEAYTNEASKPEHRGTDVLVLTNVLVDIALAARVAGRDLSGLIEGANEIADREWYFAEAILREAR